LQVPQGNEQLVFLPLAEPRVERQIGILCRKGHSLSPAAAELMGFLKAQMQNGRSEHARDGGQR
jgi:DNA-binding transcriptional LysR family regulator